MTLTWLITLLVVVLVVGLLVYIFEKAPIDPTFKLIGKAVAIVGFVIWLLLEIRKLLP
jgi:hypothetical protein